MSIASLKNLENGVATPPHAVIFGSAYLRIPNMIITGIWMNILSIFLLSILVFSFLPLVWEIIIDKFPFNFAPTP